MATALTAVFGSDLNVAVAPRDIERQYVGFPGAHGVTTMFGGSRGRSIVISFTVKQAGINYAAARTACQAAIDAIEAYMFAAAADYTHAGITYQSVVWDRIAPVPDGEGKLFRWLAGGYVSARYVAYGRQLS